MNPGDYVLWRGRIPEVPYLCLRVYHLIRHIDGSLWEASRGGKVGTIDLSRGDWSTSDGGLCYGIGQNHRIPYQAGELRITRPKQTTQPDRP